MSDESGRSERKSTEIKGASYVDAFFADELRRKLNPANRIYIRTPEDRRKHGLPWDHPSGYFDGCNMFWPDDMPIRETPEVQGDEARPLGDDFHDINQESGAAVKRSMRQFPTDERMRELLDDDPAANAGDAPTKQEKFGKIAAETINYGKPPNIQAFKARTVTGKTLTITPEMHAAFEEFEKANKPEAVLPIPSRNLLWLAFLAGVEFMQADDLLSDRYALPYESKRGDEYPDIAAAQMETKAGRF